MIGVDTSRWRRVPLGDAIELVYGRSLSEKNRRKGSVPVYGSNGVVGWHDEALVKGPTLIIGRKGAAGAVHLATEPSFPIDTTYYTRVRPGYEFDLTFLSHAMRAMKLDRLKIVVAVPGLNRDHAYREQLPCPPMDEQRRIVDLLSRAENIVRMRREAEQKAKEIIPALFLEMFGDPGNPARDGNGRTATEVVPFGSLGTLDRGKSRHRPRDAAHLYGGKTPFIQTGDVAQSGGIIDSYTQTYSEAGVAQSRVWPAGTLCITIAANIANTGVLSFEACFPDSIVGFLPSDRIKTEYIQQWLGFLRPTLETQAPQAAQKNINLDILRNLQIQVPSFNDQERFAEQVAALRRLHIWHGRATALAEQAFRSLLAGVFSGGRAI